MSVFTNPEEDREETPTPRPRCCLDFPGIDTRSAQRICEGRAVSDIEAWLASDMPLGKNDPAAYLATVLLRGAPPPSARSGPEAGQREPVKSRMR